MWMQVLSPHKLSCKWNVKTNRALVIIFKYEEFWFCCLESSSHWDTIRIPFLMQRESSSPILRSNLHATLSFYSHNSHFWVWMSMPFYFVNSLNLVVRLETKKRKKHRTTNSTWSETRKQIPMSSWFFAADFDINCSSRKQHDHENRQWQ